MSIFVHSLSIEFRMNKYPIQWHRSLIDAQFCWQKSHIELYTPHRRCCVAFIQTHKWEFNGCLRCRHLITFPLNTQDQQLPHNAHFFFYILLSYNFCRIGNAQNTVRWFAHTKCYLLSRLQLSVARRKVMFHTLCIKNTHRMLSDSTPSGVRQLCARINSHVHCIHQ